MPRYSFRCLQTCHHDEPFSLFGDFINNLTSSVLIGWLTARHHSNHTVAAGQNRHQQETGLELWPMISTTTQPVKFEAHYKTLSLR